MERMSDEENFRREYNTIPRPVVESRRDKTPPQYSPEVMFNGANWIVGPPQTTHDAAVLVATGRCEAIQAAMIDAGMALLAGCKKAKA